MKPLTIIDAMSDTELFGKDFTSRRDTGSWEAWKAFLATLYGLPVSASRAEVVRACTGLETAPDEPVREAFVVCGRRSGKSRTASLIAVFEAAFVDHRAHLAPGETAVVGLIARDRSQARVLFRYVKGLLKRPMLARLVVRETATEIELNTNASIEIMTAGQNVRGYTMAAAVCDEIAYWPSSELCAEPDREVLSALRPALTLGGKLICVSTPYRQVGVLYEAFRQFYGQSGPTLVWRGTTEQMNPLFDRGTIEREIARDPEAGRSEWLAEWRSDLQSHIPRELVDRAMVPGRHELPPRMGVSYLGYCDPSGGRHDAMTLAIAHQEGSCTVLDRLEAALPPFSPDAVVKDFAAVLKPYGLSAVHGDRYAAAWSEERFRAHGVAYLASERTTSEHFVAFLPLLTSNTVELLDHGQLRHERARCARAARLHRGSASVRSPAAVDDRARRRQRGACRDGGRARRGVRRGRRAARAVAARLQRALRDRENHGAGAASGVSAAPGRRLRTRRPRRASQGSAAPSSSGRFSPTSASRPRCLRPGHRRPTCSAGVESRPPGSGCVRPRASGARARPVDHPNPGLTPQGTAPGTQPADHALAHRLRIVPAVPLGRLLVHVLEADPAAVTPTATMRIETSAAVSAPTSFCLVEAARR